MVLILFNNEAIDGILRRNTAELKTLVGAHIIVNTSSISPQYCRELVGDMTQAGGWYVEAPVSGSRNQQRRLNWSSCWLVWRILSGI